MQELPERRSGKLQEGKRERGFNGVTQLSVSRSHAVLKEKKNISGHLLGIPLEGKAFWDWC